MTSTSTPKRKLNNNSQQIIILPPQSYLDISLSGNKRQLVYDNEKTFHHNITKRIKTDNHYISSEKDNLCKDFNYNTLNTNSSVSPNMPALIFPKSTQSDFETLGRNYNSPRAMIAVETKKSEVKKYGALCNQLEKDCEVLWNQLQSLLIMKQRLEKKSPNETQQPLDDSLIQKQFILPDLDMQFMNTDVNTEINEGKNYREAGNGDERF